MHRDVKPRNVLINRRSHRRHHDGTSIHRQQYGSRSTISLPPPLMLIDLGLADMYLPNTAYNVRVASRHYKSPELLVGYKYYDYGMDLWGVGCILAGLLWRREPFFRGKNNLDQLGKIVAVLGTRDLLAYTTKYSVTIQPELRKVLASYVQRGDGRKERMTWSEYYYYYFHNLQQQQSDGNNTMNVQQPLLLPSYLEEGCDLLDKLLVYDHTRRWTAKQAMQHTFFDPVREKVHREIQKFFPHYQ